VATLVSLIPGFWMGLQHGSWIVVTSLLLLRPDSGPTFPRILARMIGASLGVAVVLGGTQMLGTSTPALIVSGALAAYLVYAIGGVNYAVFVAAISASIVAMTAIGGGDPTTLMFARWVDILIGSAICLGLAVAMPIWTGERAIRDAVDYAKALSAWFSELAQACSLPSAQRKRVLAELDSAGRLARSRRVDLETSLKIATVEPVVSDDALAAHSQLLRSAGQSVDAGIAVLHLVAGGIAADRAAATASSNAASSWNRVAELLTTSPRGDTPATRTASAASAARLPQTEAALTAAETASRAALTAIRRQDR